MSSLLFGISLAALLSLTSFLIVLLRVSPLSSPYQAVPAFFISLFMTVCTVGALLLYMMWKYVPYHTWDAGKLLSVSLRQGAFLGLAVVVILGFHLFGLLNWWIAGMIFAMFVMIELALEQ